MRPIVQCPLQPGQRPTRLTESGIHERDPIGVTYRPLDRRFNSSSVSSASYFQPAASSTWPIAAFIIDRQGGIRWRHIEAAEGLEDLFKFPSDEDIVAAARGL